MTKEKDKQPATQDDTQDQEPSEEPTEPTQAEYDASPEDQGGSQEHSGLGGSNLAPGSVAGTPEPEPSGLEVPGSWRGVDEPGQVGEESEDESADSEESNDSEG